VIATPAPEFGPGDIEQLLKNKYQLTGELRPLVSERDQNFKLTAADERCYVVKIANSAENEVITDFQIQALQHLQAIQCRVPVPRIVPTSEGSVVTSIGNEKSRHLVRVVTYLPGVPLEGIAPDVHLGYELGAGLATIDQALCDFEHPGDHQDLLWDMQRATELRGLVQHVEEPGLRSVVHRCLDDFENHATPAFASLRRQVIHNDLNPGNVLVTDDGTAAVAGVIDFGDMLRAPLIVDVAIAASYLRAEGDNALDPAISLAAGFNSVTTLDDREIALLYDLVRTRLATTITIMHWRKSLRSNNDAYLQKAFTTEHSSERFLEKLNGVSREYFVDRIRGACVSNQV
jgi:Ser/Thr protein kinase RdoA (MazF antagonist)